MILLAAFAAAGLTPLLQTCDPIAASHGMCGSDIYKPVWQRFETSTGEIIKVNVNSVKPIGAGAAMVTTYTFAPGTRFDPSRLIVLTFDCHGQYAPLGEGMVDAPPRSVIGVLAAKVCKRADVMRSAKAAQ